MKVSTTLQIEAVFAVSVGRLVGIQHVDLPSERSLEEIRLSTSRGMRPQTNFQVIKFREPSYGAFCGNKSKGRTRDNWAMDVVGGRQKRVVQRDDVYLPCRNLRRLIPPSPY
jgi:hypothetical protein